jgi:RND family efflux transporter MFP subunit
VVTQKLIDPGNIAAPGVPLLTVEDGRTFRLEVRIDESRAALVALGQAVEVAIDGAGASTLTGHVAELATVLDPNAHAFLVKIELPPATGVRAGMFGRARFPGQVRRALAVPDTAIVRRGQVTSLFVVSDQVARLRLVTVGEPFNGHVEVRAGLDAGEQIVVNPPAALADGSPVKPRRLAVSGTGDRESPAGERHRSSTEVR